MKIGLLLLIQKFSWGFYFCEDKKTMRNGETTQLFTDKANHAIVLIF